MSQTAIRYRDGDHTAGNELVREHEALVRAIARKAARLTRADVDDLRQACRIALVAAARSWNPERASFVTHAVWQMRGEMRTVILAARTVTIPAWVHMAMRKATWLDLEPTTDAMRAAGLLRPASHVSCDHDLVGRVLSVDLHPYRALGSQQPTQESHVADAEESERIDSLLRATLGEREREVIKRRFLGDDVEPMGVVGADMGVTKQRVHQLEKRALKKLRARVGAWKEAA